MIRYLWLPFGFCVCYCGRARVAVWLIVVCGDLGFPGVVYFTVWVCLFCCFGRLFWFRFLLVVSA